MLESPRYTLQEYDRGAESNTSGLETLVQRRPWLVPWLWLTPWTPTLYKNNGYEKVWKGGQTKGKKQEVSTRRSVRARQPIQVSTKGASYECVSLD